MLFQALTWEARDVNDEEGNVSDHQISVFGKTDVGKSVCVSFNFKPYLFVRIPDDRPGTQREILRKIEERCPGCVVTATLEHKKDIWGYSHGEVFPFLRIESKALAHRKQIESFLRRVMYLNCKSSKWQPKVYEANLDPCLAFMHRSGISSTGWLETGEDCRRCNLNRVDIDLWCAKWETLRPVERDDVAPFVLASFDIESNSSTGKFPDPHVQDDACFQIGVTLCEIGKEDQPFDKTCFCYKKTSGLEGTHVLSFDTEREMLEAFGEYIHDKSIDIMYGWNIFGFDLEYIITRAMIVKCSPSFFCLGRIKDRPSKLVYKTLSSSALGDNNLKLVPMPGRFIFDMFFETKKNYKLDSYSLNMVSKKFLGDQKIDMPPKEMFKRFREGDPDKLAEVAEYCVYDTLLPSLLLKKMCTLLNMLEMAKATWVPLQYLVERGQQIKVFSQLCKKADDLGFRVPTFKYGSVSEEGYVGATVLDAQKGAYYTPITALDFASLYPSIMMAHNLCYSTLVMDGNKYGHLEGVEYEEFQVGDRVYKFVQNVPSVLPSILNELKAFRKKAKKDMANATGFMKDVYNGKQLAFKVSMNSMYGFTGASKGMLPCMAIASTTTSKGRSMIEETKNYVEENFRAKVRYGDTDSVMVEFDVQGRTGQDALDYSWELGERAAKECTALFKKPNDLELEKVYCPYFLYSKKRYAAKLWEMGKSGRVEFKYIDVKGLQLVRRDNTPHVRRVLKEVLDCILASSDPKAAIDLARERAMELLTGDVSNDELILSQSLADSYKNPNLAHVQVRNKIRDRAPGSEPQSGDRVPYILTKTDDPKAKAYEKAEDPKYVEEHGVPVDYHYYFMNKFLNPVCDLVEPLVKDPKQEIFGEIIERYKPPKKKRAPKQKTTITSLFKAFEERARVLP